MTTLRSILILFFSYFVLGKLSLLLAIPPGYSSPIWPASGVALGFVLVRGYRVYPGIFLASFLLNVSTSIDLTNNELLVKSILIALCIAIGAVLQALISGFLVRVSVQHNMDLTKPEDIAKFFLFGGVLGCLISPFIGTAVLSWNQMIPNNALLSNAFTWWTGDLLGVFLFGPLTLVWLLHYEKVWKKRQFILTIPIVFSLMLVVGLFTYWQSANKVHLTQKLEQQAERVQNAFENQLNEIYVALDSINSFYKSSTFVSRGEFEIFTSNTFKTVPMIQSLAWVPRVDSKDRNAFIKRAIDDGISDFSFKQVDAYGKLKSDFDDRDVYYPVYYIEPYEENKRAIGINNGSEKKRFNILEKTRDHGYLDASEALILAQDRKEENKSVLFTVPVYEGVDMTSIEGRRKQLKGFITATISVNDLLQNIIEQTSLALLQLKVEEISLGREKLLFSYNTDLSIDSKLKPYAVNIKVGHSQTWKFTFIPSLSFAMEGHSWTLWLLTIAVLVLTGLLNVLFLIITGQTIEASRLVDQRTESLNAVNDELEQQIIKQEQISKELEKNAINMHAQQMATLNILEDVEEAKLYADQEREKAQDAQKQVTLIIESSPYGVIMCNDDGEMTMVNKQIEEYFGYSRKELLGQKVEFLIPERYHHNHVKHRHNYNVNPMPRSMGQGRELLGKRKDGSEFNVEITLNKITIHGEAFVLATMLDVTERKEAQRKMQEAADMKSEFASIVSHELRTPLTAIKESISMVFQGVFGELNEKQKQFLSLSKRNVDRLSSLINDVLDYQKLTDGKMQFYIEQNDMNAVIVETVEVMKPHARQKNIPIIVELQDDLPLAYFDHNKVIQVLSNLINNAIKFTDKGSIVVKSYAEDNTVHVEVQDSGMGIQEEDMSRLFQSFEQFGGSERKVGGTGLGLAICQQLIVAQNGKIWAESKWGEGSVFHFVMPVKERRKLS